MEAGGVRIRTPAGPRRRVFSVTPRRITLAQTFIVPETPPPGKDPVSHMSAELFLPPLRAGGMGDLRERHEKNSVDSADSV